MYSSFLCNTTKPMTCGNLSFEGILLSNGSFSLVCRVAFIQLQNWLISLFVVPYSLSSPGITKAHLWIKKKEKWGEDFIWKGPQSCITLGPRRERADVRSLGNVRGPFSHHHLGVWHQMGPRCVWEGCDLSPKASFNPHQAGKIVKKWVGPRDEPLESGGTDASFQAQKKLFHIHFSTRIDNGFSKCSFLFRKTQTLILFLSNVGKTFLIA